MPRRPRVPPTAPKPGETLLLAIENLFEKILASEESEFTLTNSLTAPERAYIHQRAQEMGLISKSKGKHEKRCMTIYKREGSTIVRRNAMLALKEPSMLMLESLMSRYPLAQREKQELLPPTERDRNQSMDLVREMKMGKLSSTRPMQIPPAAKRSPDMERWRKNLPVYQKREEILQTIAANPVCIIQGDTGCGKTTQIPQYILEYCREQKSGCRVIVTEPRRLACMSVCERVCAERHEHVGSVVGYQIRLESKLSPDTIVTFCTPGIVIQSMLNEVSMSNVSHVIVDEVHERDRFCDFLLICLRDMRVRFPQLRIILMSATINTQLFEKYFTCPVITVPGRTYPVKEFYLYDALKLTDFKTREMMELQQTLRLNAHGNEQVQPAVAPLGKPAEVVDENAAREMDHLIEKAFNCGDDDSLMKLLHVLLSEDYPIDYRHSTTGITALMVAAARNRVQMVETLLRYGADKALQARNGHTALEIARSAEAADSAAFLQTIQGEVVDLGENAPSFEEQIVVDSYQRTMTEKNDIDGDLIVKLIVTLLKNKSSGAILVFLPGSEDILRVRDKFREEESQLPDRIKCRLYLLHSQFRNDSKAVFKPAPDRARKVILSTNIAETSITIDDVVYVIDTGKVKQKSLDVYNGISQLECDWISKSCAEQRKGRAGRCREGICYRLYTKQRYNSFEKFTTPEMLRTSLADLCLQAKLFSQNNCTIAEFLGKAVEPPNPRVTRDAVQLLKTIDALNSWEDLTPLGICLLNLSTDPRFGKMLLYAVILKCLDPVLTIVACMDYRDPFIIPTSGQERRYAKEDRKSLSEDTLSDHFVFLRIYQGWQQAVQTRTDFEYCTEHFISPSTMEMIQKTRTQLLGQLKNLGLVRKQSGDIRELNVNSESWAVVKTALCAGLYPNVSRIDKEHKVLRTRKECKVTFHMSSVLRTDGTAEKAATKLKDLPTEWVLYTDLVKVGPFCHFRTCTLVIPLTVALVCCPAQHVADSLHDDGFRGDLDADSDSEVEEDLISKNSLTVDDWIELRGSHHDIEPITYARNKLSAICLRRLTACASPAKSPSSVYQADESFIKDLISVIINEDKWSDLPQPSGVGQRPKSSDGVLLEGIQNNLHISQNNHVFQRSRQWSQQQMMHNRGDSGVDRPEGSNNIATRYFVVRSPSARALESAFVRCSWQFSKGTEKKLREAREDGGELIIFFSAYQTFHGVAKLGMGHPQPGLKWPLHWLKKHAVSIDSARTIPMPEHLRGVPLNRDGLELPESVGRALLTLWERSIMGPRPYHDDFAHRGMRPFHYLRNM